MSLKINIDVEGLAKQCKEFITEARQDLMKSVENLAAITHAKVVEMASQELDTSRQEFMDSLGFEEVAEGIWVVSVDQPGLWVEEGIKDNFDMKPGLLKDGEVGKKGKYRIIPFEHSKPKSQLTPAAETIVQQLKRELRKQKVPFKKIERNSWGIPKEGRLHSLSLPSDIPGKGNTPALSGVNIYQTMTNSGNVRRDILTFRTVTDRQQGKWIHPGFEAKHFLDRAMDWALKEWEDKILPEVMKKWKE